MYYAERMIEGILHYKVSPNGKWITLSLEELSRRVVNAESTIAQWERNEKTRLSLKAAAEAIGLD